MLRKPLLPEWRYWPGIAFAGLIYLAWLGWSSQTIPMVQPKHQETTNSDAYKEIWKEISAFFGELIADDYIAVFTGLTAIIFFGQLCAMRRTNEHNAVTERAYVKVSPYEPGVIWDSDVSGGHDSLQG